MELSVDIPVIQVVKELVEFLSGVEARSLGYETVVGFEESRVKTTKHCCYPQFIFVMSVERGWVENHYKKIHNARVNN